MYWKNQHQASRGRARTAVALAGFLPLLAASALAMDAPASLAECARIDDGSRRLECYDRLAAASAGATPERAVPPARTETGDKEQYSLARYWELTPEYKRGVFAFRPHLNNYALFLSYSGAPNEAPFGPSSGQSSGLSHTELKYQLGFKLKLVENISARHADLWFAYTQQSYWQAYNSKASSPFRETNYQPEVFTTVPVDWRLLGMHVRFVNLGLVHQSNGRSATLSRSWNRLYAQLGMERGDFTLLARIWKRLPEPAGDDDNPDILDYMGYGDVAGTYRWNGHEFSALVRQNFRTSRGAVQLGWAFPLKAHLKGYVQLFSGYGQSLIDYNYSGKTIGVGVQIDY